MKGITGSAYNQPNTAARASNSKVSEFCSVLSINYAAAIDRRASSAAVANSKLCLSRPWKKIFPFETVDGSSSTC